MSSSKMAMQGQGRDARMRRHARALMQLAQRLWQSGNGLNAALTAITETAAHVLEVERVNVWQLNEDGQLRCVHGYQHSGNVHNVPGFDERLAIAGTAYAQALPSKRVIQTADAVASFGTDPAGSLARYLHRHGIHSLIDAPVRVGSELYGVICHEHVGAPREWRRDEIAFAGNMSDFVALALEIERRKRAEARLDYLELHDPVTGLANRSLLHGAMEDLLRRQRKRPRLAALLFVDVDRFYSVNESVGEIGGDVALAELGERINAVTPDEAIIARVESDCFAVLLPRLAQEWQAVRQAEDILAALGEPLRIEQLEFAVSASIGIAFNQGDTSLTTSDILLRDADLASKQAKQLGRNRCEVFDPDQHRGLLDRVRVEYSLRDALRNNELVVVYQPEIDLIDGSVVAAEALLRWRDADGALRTASDFIDVAESSGLIVSIGRWVLHQACSDANHWPLAPDGRARVLGVNLSARQFEQPGLVEMVTEVLRETGFEPQRLCLEITETTLMSHAQSALDTLHALKALGVSLAVDDFGTGYSSLAYLKRFPVDVLKIDKSMIDGLPGDPHAHAIIVAVLGLAQAMRLGVVVEGVEQLVQETELRAMGCRRAQGWLYARGEPQGEFVARLHRTR